MKKKLLIITLLALLSFALPVYAQYEGGDSTSIVEVVRAELQPLGLLVLFTAVGTGLWIVIEGLRALRNRNVEIFTIVLDGVEYIVKVSKNKFDDKFFYLLKKFVVRDTPVTIETLRDEINKANK